jgi:hypothetical protein
MFKDGQVQATQIGAVGKAQLAQIIDKALAFLAIPSGGLVVRRSNVGGIIGCIPGVSTPHYRPFTPLIRRLVSPAPEGRREIAT